MASLGMLSQIFGLASVRKDQMKKPKIRWGLILTAVQIIGGLIEIAIIIAQCACSDGDDEEEK